MSVKTTGLMVSKWNFPEIGAPQVIIHFFSWIFHEINHPAMGVPHLWNPPAQAPRTWQDGILNLLVPGSGLVVLGTHNEYEKIGINLQYIDDLLAMDHSVIEL